MKQTEVNRFNKLYERHLRLLKLQGKAQKTIDAYSRSVRRIRDPFDCCPDKLIAGSAGETGTPFMGRQGRPLYLYIYTPVSTPFILDSSTPIPLDDRPALLFQPQRSPLILIFHFPGHLGHRQTQYPHSSVTYGLLRYCAAFPWL